MYQPDQAATFTADGETYIVTANEGDDRGDFDEGGDAARVGDILDGDVMLNGSVLSIDASVDTTGLERLNVSIIDGDTDGDGDIDIVAGTLGDTSSTSLTWYRNDGSKNFTQATITTGTFESRTQSGEISAMVSRSRRTTNRHGCRLQAEGARRAASNTYRSLSSSTARSLNFRTEQRRFMSS